eukprot:6181986-Pleurochrysis_carterae.AAC.1
MHEEWGVDCSTISWVLKHVLRAGIACCAEEAHGASHELVGVAQFAGVLLWDVGETHDVVPVAHRRGSSVMSVGRGEQSGNGKRRARWRGEYGGIVSPRAPVELCASPPPERGSLSIESAAWPKRERNAATPSRRCTGPEKRRRARFGSGTGRSSGTRCGGPVRLCRGSGSVEYRASQEVGRRPHQRVAPRTWGASHQASTGM